MREMQITTRHAAQAAPPEAAARGAAAPGAARAAAPGTARAAARGTAPPVASPRQASGPGASGGDTERRGAARRGAARGGAAGRGAAGRGAARLPARVLAAAALCAALAPLPASASSYVYTFTVTREAERVKTDFFNRWDFHRTDHPDVPEMIEPGWVDPAWLGADYDWDVFGLEVGESAPASFSFHDTGGHDGGSYALVVGGTPVTWGRTAFVSERDPVSGDAAFEICCGYYTYVLNFIRDEGHWMDDRAGDIGAYGYHGYTTYFTLSDVERLTPTPRADGPAPRSLLVPALTEPVAYAGKASPPLASMPVPAAPVLLLTALGALALLRRRRA